MNYEIEESGAQCRRAPRNACENEMVNSAGILERLCEKWITITLQQPIINEPNIHFAKALCLPKYCLKIVTATPLHLQCSSVHYCHNHSK
jgi:hypothetical protein